jgi:hypothetical protein
MKASFSWAKATIADNVQKQLEQLCRLSTHMYQCPRGLMSLGVKLGLQHLEVTHKTATQTLDMQHSTWTPMLHLSEMIAKLTQQPSRA